MGLWSNIKDKGMLAMTRIKDFLLGKKENLQLNVGREEYSETVNDSNFMSHYPMQKSSEELEYERQNPSYFYQIGEKKYKMSNIAMLRLKNYVDENQVPLKQISNGNFLMGSDAMDEMQKNNLLNEMVNTYYDSVGGAFFVEQGR